MLTAEIIAIGSELLAPTRTDTNSLWLTEQLNRIGIDVKLKTIVGDDEFSEIGREFDKGAVTCLDVGASLHLFVDDEDLALTSGCGNQRSFESETVDFAEDAAALPSGPRFLEINRDADDDPSERGGGGFEGRTEGF